MFEGGSDSVRHTTSERERVTVAAVREATEAVASLVAALDPDDVLLSESVDMWREFSLLGRLAVAGTTLLARRVDESRRWATAGHRSVDEFLAAEGGQSLGYARRQRRASERLRDLPDTSDAMRGGRLSREQADVISDAAAANPAAEDRLLDDAGRKSLRDLKDECGRAKAAADRDPDATQRRIRAGRRFTSWSDPDGGHRFSGVGPVEDAAIVNAALQPIVDRLVRTRRKTPEQAERQAYTWDALVELARHALGAPIGEHSRGSGSAASRTDQPEQSATIRSSTPRYLGILRMDLAALARGWVEGDEVCEIAGLVPVPVTRARELLGEASLRLVLTKGVDVQNITYLGRGPNAAQKIALLWSQPICTNIACGNTWLQNDHREPYAQVNKTELHNIDPLCPHDHDLKTHHGWALATGTGRRPFVSPDDSRHPERRKQPGGHAREGP